MGSFRSNNRGGFGGRSRFSDHRPGGRSEGGDGFRRRPSNNRFEGRPRRRDDFEERDSGRPERQPLAMHDAVCAKCGKDCFRKNDGPRNDRGASSGITAEQFNQLNAKLDKILQILEAVTEVEDEEESEEDK